MEIDQKLLKTIKITPILESLKLENISDEEYFGEKYRKDYISNSRLGLLKNKGAKVFFEGLGSVKEFNPSFEFGSWLHELFLQPENFELIKGVFTPTAKARLMALELFHPDGSIPTDDEIKIASYKVGYYKDKLTSSRISELREKCNNFWRDRFLFEKKNPDNKNKERLFVDEKSFNLLNECLNSINNNKSISKILSPDYISEKPYKANEQTILMDVLIEVPEYDSRIFKLKSKLDNFIIDKEDNTITVNDLKTTSKLANEFDPTYYSYQRELGMYSYLLKLCAKKFFNLEKPSIKGNFLVVSLIPEYNSLVYPMTPKLFKQGFEEFKYLLKIVAYLNIVKGYEFK